MPTLQTTPPVPQPHGSPFRAGFDGNALEGTFHLTTPEDIDTLVKFLQLNKVMIMPVHETLKTEYTDDEEGREAKERNRKLDEEFSNGE